MRFKKITYNSTHVPEFKKYIVCLGLFLAGMLVVGIFQAYLLVSANNKNINLTDMQVVAGFGCAIISFVFILFMCKEIVKYVCLIRKIKNDGFTEKKMLVFDFSKKFSFGNIYRFFEYILLTVIVVFAAVFTTYSVLNYMYYTITNYYLPVVLMVLLTTTYSVKMIELQYVIEKE